MKENESMAFHGMSCAFLPCLLEAGIYTAARLEHAELAAWRTGRPKADYFFFHCTDGICEVYARGKAFLLKANCTLLLPGNQTVEIPAERGQRFTALRFRCEKGKPPLQPEVVYSVPDSPVEELFYAALVKGGQEAKASRAQLDLYFALLLSEWAELAGREDGRKGIPSIYEGDIRRAISYLTEHMDEKIQMSALARQLNLSERNFRKLFTEQMGVSPKAYLQSARLGRAKELLRAQKLSIHEISEAVGYYSQFQFSRDFKKEFGITPSDYRGGKRF